MENIKSAGISRRTFAGGAALGMAAAPIMARAQISAALQPNGSAENVLKELLADYPIPAVSAAVVRDGTLVWEDARGIVDLEAQIPARPDHVFRLGSVSKVITAAIGARLAGSGAVDLDAPIATYRPDLPEHHRATTLRQLFNHLGGVRHYGESDLSPMSPAGSIDTRIFRNTQEALDIFIDDPLIAQPGTTSSYSTFGYTLISAVLESATGEDFRDLIAQQVTTPLSLGEMMPDEQFAIVANRVRFYDPPPMYRGLFPLPDIPAVNALPSGSGYKWAGGGILGSARDTARFGAAQLAGNYLDDAMRNTLFTIASPASERMPALGLGWRIDNHDMLGRRFHHAGNMQGCRAQLALYPDHGLSVALMSNFGATPGPILNYADRIASGFIA